MSRERTSFEECFLEASTLKSNQVGTCDGCDFCVALFLCVFFPCLTSSCVQGVMAGRNDSAIVDALQALAQAIRNPNRG